MMTTINTIKETINKDHKYSDEMINNMPIVITTDSELFGNVIVGVDKISIRDGKIFINGTSYVSIKKI